VFFFAAGFRFVLAHGISYIIWFATIVIPDLPINISYQLFFSFVLTFSKHQNGRKWKLNNVRLFLNCGKISVKYSENNS